MWHLLTKLLFRWCRLSCWLGVKYPFPSPPNSTPAPLLCLLSHDRRQNFTRQKEVPENILHYLVIFSLVTSQTSSLASSDRTSFSRKFNFSNINTSAGTEMKSRIPKFATFETARAVNRNQGRQKKREESNGNIFSKGLSLSARHWGKRDKGRNS